MLERLDLRIEGVLTPLENPPDRRFDLSTNLLVLSMQIDELNHAIPPMVTWLARPFELRNGERSP